MDFVKNIFFKVSSSLDIFFKYFFQSAKLHGSFFLIFFKVSTEVDLENKKKNYSAKQLGFF